MFWLAFVSLGALIFTFVILFYKPHVNYVNTYVPPQPPAQPPGERPAGASGPMSFNDVFGAKNYLDDSNRPQA